MLSGIILSAGESSRMHGRVKALLDLNGKSFIENIIENMSCLPLGELIIVLGAHSEEVNEKLKRYDIKVVVNDEWEKGQIYSLRAGIGHLSPESEGVMFTLVDHPLVTILTYKKLVDAWMGDKSRIVLPSYNMRKGHPAIFPGFLYSELLDRDLPGGARDLLKEYRDIIRFVTVDDPGIVKDVDTIGDYNRLKAEL
jgi:molybdenum cofactor cytidylyltransferase